MLPILIILIVLILLVGWFFVFLLDSALGKQDFTTNREVAREIIKFIRQKGLEGGKFYDLGSGRGGFASRLAKALPKARITGIDDNWFRTFSARFRSVSLPNANFRTGNIFRTDVSSSDLVYLYLPQELMADLQAKLQKELKPGALVISNKVSFANWQPIEKFKQLSIYQI